MSENDSTPPVACTLSEEGKEARPDRVQSVLTENFAGAEEQPDGYTLVFEGTDESLSALATFVANEHQCCSFAEYGIEVSPPYEETRLTITGPDGTKDVFGEDLVGRLEAEGD